MVNTDSLKLQINNISPADLEARGVITAAKAKVNGENTYICPSCDNGTGDTGDGLAVKKYSWGYNLKCFKCGKSFDNIDLLSMHYGLNARADFVEVCKRAAADFLGIFDFDNNSDFSAYHNLTPADNKPAQSDSDKEKSPAQDKSQEQEKAIEEKMFEYIQADILAAYNFSINPKSEYTVDERRGVYQHTLDFFHCGIIENHIAPRVRAEYDFGKRDKLPPPSRRLIIPTTDGLHYLATLSPADRKNTPEKYWKMHAGKMSESTFGLQTLSLYQQAVFVCEGEFDCMSMYQEWTDYVDENSKYLPDNFKAGFIATISATGAAWISELEKTFNESQKPLIMYVADDDDAGRRATEKSRAEMIKRGFPFYSFTFPKKDGKKVDANDILRNEESGTLFFYLVAATLRAIESRSELLKEIDAAAHKEKEAAGKGAAEIQAAPADEEPNIAFIQDERTRADFVKLQNSPPSKERDSAIRQIILDNLDWKINKTGKRLYPLPTVANFRRIFENDPALVGLFGYEEFKGEIIFIRQPYWRKNPCVNSQWTDTDDSRLRIHLRENYADLSSKFTTDDLFSVVATENSFNLVKDYFHGLPIWDGKPRAESLFIDFLKVEDTEFVRAITFKWLLAAVCRIFYPACNFQAALVLQGKQNIGKSYILEKLGGDWYGNLIDSVDDRHSVEAIRNIWICEIKEMSAMRRAEINATKSFIERPADNYRAAYAKRAQTYKRHCVFAISVNDKQFLRDLTGNRRYWILESPLEEFAYIEGLTGEYIQQIWAEVYTTFKELTANGFNDKILELPLEFKQQAEIIAEKFTANDGLAAEVAAFLDIPILPLPVWNLLTLPEKQKFFIDNSITVEKENFDIRKGRVKESTIKEIEVFCKSDFTQEVSTQYQVFYKFFGCYIRNETCASEIANELPTMKSKRANIIRINEALSLLDGWTKSGISRKNFNGYGHQVNCYCRLVPAENDIDFSERVDVPF